MISKSSTGVTAYANLYGESLLIESDSSHAQFKLENPRKEPNDWDRGFFGSEAEAKRVVKKFIKKNELSSWEIRRGLSDYWSTDDLELIKASENMDSYVAPESSCESKIVVD